MSENTELALLDDITEDKWPEVYGVGKVNDFYERVKAELLSKVPDLSTQKGRDAIASDAFKVSKSKTFVEKPGRAYLKYIKETKCKAIEEELREYVQKMDALRDEVRKPLSDWEAEQARIKAEKEAAEAEAERVRLSEIAARELQEQVDRDHELAIYQYADYLREKEAAAKQAVIDAELAVKAQKEREEQIAKQAAENAAEAERNRIADEQERKDREAQAAIAKAEREKLEAENARLRQEQQAKDAAAKAEADKIAAAKKAEDDKQAAIEAERKRALAEAVAQAAEAVRREKDVANKKRVNNEILADLATAGIDEATAKAVITAIAKGLVRNIKINY
jgi:hypothetical protein